MIACASGEHGNPPSAAKHSHCCGGTAGKTMEIVCKVCNKAARVKADGIPICLIEISNGPVNNLQKAIP